jgi:hypothetical protein
MGESAATTTAVGTIAAMVTPGLLMLGSASLVASALVRMARVVDRARTLAGVVSEGTWTSIGATPRQLRSWLDRHAIRARYAARAIAALYAAIVVFISTCLAIAADRALGGSLQGLPLLLAIVGTVLLLAGASWMVAESSLSGKQIAEEIRVALSQLEGVKS